jgi:hypothetical protein
MGKKTRRKWQKEKLATDKDYRENQKDAQKRWAKLNPDYWSKYRKTHPEYTEKNRENQKERNDKRKLLLNLPDSVKSEIAKMDSSYPKTNIITGYYRLIPLYPKEIAKMDEFIVKIDIISSG